MNLDSERRLAIVLRICEFFTSSVTSTPTGTYATGAAAFSAEAEAAGAAFADGVNPSTSLRTIRPFSPLPFTSERLIALS